MKIQATFCLSHGDEIRLITNTHSLVSSGLRFPELVNWHFERIAASIIEKVHERCDGEFVPRLVTHPEDVGDG